MCLAPGLENLGALKYIYTLADFVRVKENCLIFIDLLIWKELSWIVGVLISDTTRNWRKQQQQQQQQQQQRKKKSLLG